MSKRKLRSSGFANGVLNSYNFIIKKDLFVENCSLCDYLLKIVRYNNDFQKKFYFPVDFWETLNYNRTSWDFSCKDPQRKVSAMYKIGFDNDKYLSMQSEKIKERIAKFGGKLYLEFGGKLFDDYHASRVLPGFHPDSKINMLAQLKDEAEIVIVINAADIEKNKVRSDLGITYDLDVLRLIDAFRGYGLYVGSVCLTRFAGQPSAIAYQKKLESLGMKVYRHYSIPGYPSNIPFIVSDEGYGKNDYIETTRSLVVVTAPGPGSGKMATCLSQLYHEYKRGIKAGYAKYETFPIWNIPLKHPVNLAYEAATADLNDVNMIDPFHLEAYGETTINYNRDVEIFPVVSAMFEKIMAAALTSLLLTWVSIWQASVLSMTKLSATPPNRKSSAATTTLCARSARVPPVTTRS